VIAALAPGVPWVEVLRYHWKIPSLLSATAPERGSNVLFRGIVLEPYLLSTRFFRWRNGKRDELELLPPILASTSVPANGLELESVYHSASVHLDFRQVHVLLGFEVFTGQF
jgi:hypothetical protein